MIIRFKCLHIKKMSGKRKNNIKKKKKPSEKLALTARPATMQAQTSLYQGPDADLIGVEFHLKLKLSETSFK